MTLRTGAVLPAICSTLRATCFLRAAACLAGVMAVLGPPATAAAQPARDLYTQALARERTIRDASTAPTVQQIRVAIAAYERVVHRYPRSGYSDNALWQAANLALLAYERSADPADKRTGLRLLNLLRSGYPSSSLVPRAAPLIEQFDRVKAPPPVRSASRTPARTPLPAPADESTPAAPVRTPPVAAVRTSGPASVGDVTIRGITRTRLADGVRVSIEMDRELLFRQEELNNPRRLFFDLQGARPVPALRDATLQYSDDVVREIRLGRHPSSTRVVIDTEGVDSYSIFTLYDPYRLIVDLRRAAAAASAPQPAETPAGTLVPAGGSPAAALKPAAGAPAPPTLAVETSPGPAIPPADPGLPAPTVPAANSSGQFSLARQLGLGVSRIVLDPGHGGHDPGARANGISEAELVLDVSLRLKRLLEKQPGVEVVMTRETNVFIPLEQRTAIANREGADLFLSIHANASRNPNARGVETYFLNFASTKDAEAVAARENSASGRTMHSLPEIVRAIALNNKLEESRDFADAVQKSMIKGLSARNRELRDLGVKQAPFVVLIGAAMPSVLAEISFVTHKQESQLLKTSAYRQQIAEALLDAILRYQRSLKARSTIATREEFPE